MKNIDKKIQKAIDQISLIRSIMERSQKEGYSKTYFELEAAVNGNKIKRR